MRISDIISNSSLNEAGSWQDIYAANKSTIADPNKIQVGQKINLPNGGTYTVQKGDTLSKIAKQPSGQGPMRSTPTVQPTIPSPAQPAAPSAAGLPRGQKAAQDTLQTADDFVRSMANAATFGYADKLAAKMSSAFGGGKDYDTELKKEYGKSAEAGGRSPIASTAGEIAGTVASPAFAGGAALGTKALSKVAPNVGKIGQFVAGTAGGIAADTAAEKAAKAVDPNNPWIDESDKMKIKELTNDDVSEASINTVSSGLRANRLRGLPGGSLGSRAEKLSTQAAADLSPADKLNKAADAKVWRSGEPASTTDRLNKAAGAKVWSKTEPAAKAVTGGEKAAAVATKGGKPLSRGATAAAAAVGGGLIGYGLGSGDKGQGPKPTDDPSVTPAKPPRTNKPAKDDPYDLQSVGPNTRPGPGSQAWLDSQTSNKPSAATSTSTEPSQADIDAATKANAANAANVAADVNAKLGAEKSRADFAKSAATTGAPSDVSSAATQFGSGAIPSDRGSSDEKYPLRDKGLMGAEIKYRQDADGRKYTNPNPGLDNTPYRQPETRYYSGDDIKNVFKEEKAIPESINTELNDILWLAGRQKR